MFRCLIFITVNIDFIQFARNDYFEAGMSHKRVAKSFGIVLLASGAVVIRSDSKFYGDLKTLPVYNFINLICLPAIYLCTIDT